MPTLLRHLFRATTANLSAPEILFLAALAALAWVLRKRRRWIPAGYCTYLILYITLLRRAPGYHEELRLLPRLWAGAGTWAGNLLNLLLYVPFGAACQYWQRPPKQTVAAGFLLSLFCEYTQFQTQRGTADINDILFNTLGAALGLYLAKKIHFPKK